MKMEGVFHMPLSAANGYVFDAEQEIAAFKGANPTGRVEAAKAAAHAINCHDELVAELGRLQLAYVNLLEIGRDRIRDLGGTCDPVDVMERNDPALIRARAILTKAKGE